MDPQTLNVIGPTQLVTSGVNKVPGGASDGAEGITGEFEDEFTLKLDDEELLALAQQWEAKYSAYESQIKPRQERNKQYYMGKQAESMPEGSEVPISSNLLFEAEETFIPAALSKNPEPVVYADNTPEGTAISNDVKTMLQYHADQLVLRRKLALMVRHWSIYFVAAIKHGWDKEINEIRSDVRDPQNFVFDPDGFIDCYGDYEGPLGERIKCTAGDLIKLFPKQKAFIIVACAGKLGTEVVYTEWWNDDYCFYTFKGKVLDKNKNPNFNYPTQVESIDSLGQPELDTEGKPVMVEQKGNNHFSRPKKPYTFLSVFSLGEHPHDITGLIEQNIPNQNRITRRTNQIDTNLSRANNSIAFSEKNFNQETGKQAAEAMKKGNPVLVPDGGPISEAIVRFPAPDYPAAAFTELETSKQDLRSIFGTEGISSQPPNENTTARGMILNQQFDNTRIGGGIGDALEQVADNIFNYWVQLYYVFYDQPHFAAIMGQMKAVEYIELTSADMDRRIVVSVAPDSMKPHDELTQMNQAVQFFESGVIGPKTLLTIANFPDPNAAAEDGVLWTVDKNAYLQINFPELAAKLAQMQAAMMPQPGAQAPPGAPSAPIPPDQPPTLSEDPTSAALQNVPLPQ